MSLLDAMARAAAVGSGWIHEHEWGGPDGIFTESDWRDAVRAALAEARRQGWQLVPVEPTEKMIYGPFGLSDFTLCNPPDGRKEFVDACLKETRALYRAMLSSAPSIEEG